jgi:hypothetical protein
MNRFFPVGLALLVWSASSVSSAWAAVDPTLLDLVPANAQILYGVNVPQALASPLGKAVYQRFLMHNPALDRVGAVSGLDVKRDVRELVLVSTQDGWVTPTSNRMRRLPHYNLILARGTFRLDRFQAIAGMSGGTVMQDQGVSIITLPTASASTVTPGNPVRNSIAFLDSSTVAIGPAGVLKAVIAQKTAKAGHDGPLAQKAIAASAGNDAWFATVTPFSELALGQSSLPLPALAAIRESWGGLKLNSDSVSITIGGTTGSESDAKTLAGLLGGAVQLIKNPRTAALARAQFSTAGPALSVFVTLPEHDAEGLLQRSTTVVAANPRSR